MAAGEAEPAAGAVEAHAQHVGVGPVANHALRPGGIVELAAVALRHQRQHVRRPVRDMRFEPFLEQRLQFERQAQHRVPGGDRAGILGGGQNVFHLGIVERRDHRRRQDAGRDAGLGEGGDGFEPALRGRRARLHDPRQLAVERRHRHRDAGEAPRRHFGEDVDVALDQCALGDDRYRVAEIAQHFEDLAHDAELALGRLIGIGVGADRDRPAAIALFAELGGEQRRRLRLVEDAALEIEPGRQAEIGVARPREAIDAAVLAAAIGVDRAVEADIGRGVASDDRAGRIDRQPRRERHRLGLGTRLAPAVVERDAHFALEAAAGVRGGATSLARQGDGRHIHAGQYDPEMRTLQEHIRLSAVIPTLDAAAELPAALAALTGAALIGEVIVADGGSDDGTLAVARAAGARVVVTPRGRGTQLAAGAAAARSDWLLFLHADCRPLPGWEDAVGTFLSKEPDEAGYFALTLDDPAPAAPAASW